VTACKSCGREPENGTETHWLGCPETTKALLAKVIEADARKTARGEEIDPEYVLQECAKDDCKEPRAVSKGPRPAKYCDEHKTGSKK
jgi:hypothetical protein